MAKQGKTLQIIAMKLGLSEEEKVISKAAEYGRLLQMKSTANNITDTGKAVICLDLAASYYRVDFDQKTAVKSSGLKGPSYVNSRKIIENILELNNDKLIISGLCLTMQCSVQELAEQILEEYKKSSKMVLDMDLPQYVCMAVYQACRISKIKVPKTKFIDKSQLKPTQWSKLDAEWTKFTNDKFAAIAKKKRGGSAKNAVIEDADEKMDVDTQEIMNQEQSEPQLEPYKDWRSRVLQKSYEELEILKQTYSKNKSPKQRENTNKQLGTNNKQKTTPRKQKSHSNEPTESAVKKLDFEFPLTVNLGSPNKQKGTPNKQKVTPNKQKGTPNKQKWTPNKQEENTDKPIGSASKQIDFIMTRKSPRKTPQKFVPYMTPVKTGGVRLLFPCV